MKLSNTDIDTLLTDLSSKYTEKREKAERFYSENKAAILPRILSMIDRDMQTFQRLEDMKRNIKVLEVIISPIAVLMLYWILSEAIPSLYELYSVPICIASCILFLYWFRRIQPEPRQISILQIIEDLGSPQFVGLLIDMINERNVHIVNRVEPILYRQILLIDRSHIGLLKKHHIRYLQERLMFFCGRNEKTFDKPKSLAILRALGHIGDMTVMKSVATAGAESLSPEVREAAKECMRTISKRIREEKPRETLLRASENMGGQEELLRAANAHTDTQAETLLRIPNQE